MSNKMPIFVTHYTLGTGYEQEVERLVASLNQHGLRYHVEPFKSLGTWRANSNYGSRVIQQCMSRYPKDDIVYVDADAVIQQYPALFESDEFVADVAAHVHNFRWHPNELLGGTMFFRNKPTVRWLVDHWVWEIMVNHPGARPGDALQALLLSEKFSVTFAELPDTYTTIFDIMKDVKNPVIVHYQASRRFRRVIDRMKK